MKSNYEAQYHNLEASHFWFKARRKFILQLLKDTPKSYRILDVGCSSGLLLLDLLEQGFNEDNLYGIDISKTAIENCKSNGLANCYVMSGDDIKLKPDFDIIIASDSLEHMEHEERALKNWHNLLKKDGKVYVFVPAFKMLWSQHDVANMHFRRYTRKKLAILLTQSNFIIDRSGYWNFTLFIPVFIVRNIENIFKKSNRKENTGDLQKLHICNGWLLKLLNLENKLLKVVNFPFGISTFCIASKVER